MSNTEQAANLLADLMQIDSEPYKELLTFDDLENRYGLSKRVLEPLVRQHKIPVVRINQRVLRFRTSDIELFIAQATIPAVGAL